MKVCLISTYFHGLNFVNTLQVSIQPGDGFGNLNAISTYFEYAARGLQNFENIVVRGRTFCIAM